MVGESIHSSTYQHLFIDIRSFEDRSIAVIVQMRRRDVVAFLLVPPQDVHAFHVDIVDSQRHVYVDAVCFPTASNLSGLDTPVEEIRIVGLHFNTAL